MKRIGESFIDGGGDTVATNRIETLKEENELLKKVDFDKLKAELRVLGRNFEDNRPLESLARLLIRTKENLSGYDSIVSDDTSGRLISLIFRNIIDRKRSKNEKEPIKAFFVGSLDDRKELFQDFLKKNKDNLGRTLLVTEFIKTGESIKPIAEALKEEKIDFDLGAVSVAGVLGDTELYPPVIRDHLYFGGMNDSGSGFHGLQALSGVEKSMEDTFFPQALWKSGDERYDQESINAAREDVKMVAEEFYKLVE